MALSHRCYYLHFAQGEETEGCSASVHSVDHLHCLLHTLPHHTGEQQEVHRVRNITAVPPRRSECINQSNPMTACVICAVQVVVYFYPDMPHHVIVYHLTVTLSSLNSCMDPVVYCFVTNNFQVVESLSRPIVFHPPLAISSAPLALICSPVVLVYPPTDSSTL